MDLIAKALAARPFLQPGFRYGHIKVQNPEFRRLFRDTPYNGPVEVNVPGAQPFWMYHQNDDTVSGVYFYFGEAAYETLSTIVFSALSKRTSVIYDIGAHVGVFSLIASRSNISATTHCFEVIPTIAERARINFSISGVSNRVTLNAIGVSDKIGSMIVNYNASKPLATGSSFEDFKDRQAATDATTMEVPVTTIDKYWIDNGRHRVGLMKIDVEKHEHAVFEGAAEMLSVCRPHILAEVLSKEEFIALFGDLERFGYASAAWIDDDNLKIRPVSRDMKLSDGSDYVYRGYHNVLFSPGKISNQVAAEIGQIIASSKLAAQQFNPLLA